MEEHLYAEMACRLLRKRWALGPGRPIAFSGRHLTATVERALVGRRRRRTFLQRAAIGGACASSLMAAALTFQVFERATPLGSSRQESTASRSAESSGGSSRKVPSALFLDGFDDPDSALTVGVRLEASAARPLQIHSAVGTELELEPRASLTLEESGPTTRLALDHGALAARVAKLSPGERFIVETTDAEIEVHGTRFRISVGADPGSACAGSAVTHVAVFEGMVAVRANHREVRLAAGDEWRTTCPVANTTSMQSPGARSWPRRSRMVSRPAGPASPTGPAVRSGPVQKEGPPALESPPVSSRPAGSKPAGSRPPPSSLEAQNELFSAAMRVKRAGRTGDALDLLAQLVYEYPDSPLIESAMVQRMRLALGEDPAWAGSIATQYLAGFPEGFARVEAQAIRGVEAQQASAVTGARTSKVEPIRRCCWPHPPARRP